MGSSLVHGKYVIVKVIDDDSSEIISNGAVFQQDGVIVDVGKYEHLKSRYIPEEEIGSTNQVVMPGLINAHHHVGLTPFQLGHLDFPLELWIAKRIATRDVDTYLDTLYRGMQMIESGITTVIHNHSLTKVPSDSNPRLEADRILRAYKELGMRVNFSYIQKDQNRFVYEDDQCFLEKLPQNLANKIRSQLKLSGLNNEEYLALFQELYDSYRQNGTDPYVRISLSPANVQWCSDSLLITIKELAEQYQVGIHIHLQETIYQKIYGIRAFGKTPLAHLHDLGFLGPSVSCVHGVWLTESDIGIMAATGTSLVHNASSNLRLKSGIAPVNELKDKGVTVAIGIDEAGINDDSDLLQEMRLVQKIHCVPGIDTKNLSSHHILRMATVNGAQIASFADQVGTLEKGKRADILLIDLDHIEGPYLQPNTNIVDALLHRGRGIDVNTVIVDGKVVLRDRKFIRLDKEGIWAEIKNRMARDLQAHELEREQISREIFPYVRSFFQQWNFKVGKPIYVFNDAE